MYEVPCGMFEIEVFADVVCPFTHVGLRRIVAEREARGRTDIKLRIRAWPLELVNGKPMDPEFLRTEIEPLRASVTPDLFVGFNALTFPTTSMPAFALTAAAYRISPAAGEQVAMDLRTQLFEHGIDIGEASVIKTIAARHRVPVPDIDSQRQEIIEDWNAGKARGAIGSPHFFVGDEGFFCPTLNIQHDETGFQISIDEIELQKFLDSCFE